MKKYWKMITIIAVTILSIGTFYVHSSIAAIDFPEFVIEDQSGDKSLVESIVIDGGLNQHPLYQGLQITSTGTVYNSELSFFEKFVGINQPIIAELIEDHRKFMRGKNKYINSFYEDEQFLVYAGVNNKTRNLSARDFKFAISILDIEEDDSTSYELPIPNTTGYQYVSILDVQKMNGELKIITNNHSGASEIHIYTVDIETKTVIEDEMIISVPEVNHNGYSYIDLVKESNPKQANEYVVFKRMVLKEIEQNDQANENNDKSSVNRSEGTRMEEFITLIAYNLVTKEKKTVTLPEEFEVPGLESSDESVSGQEIATIQAFDNSDLYFMDSNNNEVKILNYNVESEKIGNVVTVQIPSNEEGYRPPSVIIKNGKVYTLSAFQEGGSTAILTVTDLKSGETLYKGQVAEEDPNPDEREYEVHIHNMTVR